MANLPPRRARIAQIRQEARSARSFALELADQEPFQFLPGQFVLIDQPERPNLRRAYSISSAPEDEHVELTIREVGEFTHHLFHAAVGDAIEVRGPMGHWTLDSSWPRIVCIAGGTGIAPFRSFARHLLATARPNHLIVLASAQTPGELLFRDEFARINERNPAIRLVSTITRPHLLAPGETWDGPTGRINLDFVAHHAGRPSAADGTLYYLCGPNALVDGVGAELLAVGVAPARIRSEKWGAF